MEGNESYKLPLRESARLAEIRKLQIRNMGRTVIVGEKANRAQVVDKESKGGKP